MRVSLGRFVQVCVAWCASIVDIKKESQEKVAARTYDLRCPYSSGWRGWRWGERGPGSSDDDAKLVCEQ